MASIKRWARRLWSGFDRVVAEIEDHDALVAAALEELERTLARAKAQLEQMRADAASLNERRSAERREAKRWRSAAANETEDFVAIEHLRKMRRANERVQRIEERIREHARAEARLERDVAALADRIADAKRHRDLLATRSAHPTFSDPASDVLIGHLLARWETVLPYAGSIEDARRDDFDALEQQEETRALWAELRELRKGGDHAC